MLTKGESNIEGDLTSLSKTTHSYNKFSPHVVSKLHGPNQIKPRILNADLKRGRPSFFFKIGLHPFDPALGFLENTV